MQSPLSSILRNGCWLLALLLASFSIVRAQGAPAAAPPAGPEPGTTLLDPLTLHSGEVRTLPRYPLVGSWSILIGAPTADPQRGVLVDTAGEAIVYPTIELLSAKVGTIDVWVTPSVAAAADAPRRVLLDSWSAAGPGRWLLSLDGTQLNLAMSGADNQTKTITAPAAWAAGTSYRITLLWDENDLSLLVNGQEVGKVEKPVLPAREPLAIALGNSTDFKNPAGAAFSDLRLSTLREAAPPPSLNRLVDTTPNIELSLKMATSYQRRLFPTLDQLRRQGVAEADYFTALASYDIGDNERAMEQVTPITKNLQHPLYQQSIFLRADLLSDQHDYAAARDQLDVLAGSKDLGVSVRAQVKQARILYEEGSSNEAKQLISELIARYPDLKVIDDAYLMIGLDQFKAGDFQRAFVAFDSVGTSGTLARQSVAIGTSLQIKVADADLSVRLADVGLPVTVTSDSGDRETVTLRPAFSRGVYLGSVMIALGETKVGDGILQVQGANDKIKVIYDDRLSAEGANVPRTVSVDLKTDATMMLVSQSSLEIYREGMQYQKAGLIDENWVVVDKLPDSASAFFRNVDTGKVYQPNERLPKEVLHRVKPGQGIYVEVNEPDADITPKADTLQVSVATSAGKKATVTLTETGPRTGIFSTVVKTDVPEKVKDDVLPVNVNESVTVSYVDPNPEPETRNPAVVAAIRVATETGSVICGLLLPVPYRENERYLVPIYRVAGKAPFVIQVSDRDLDVSDAADKVTVKMSDGKGQEVAIVLTETGGHTGVFRNTGQIVTDPAAAAAANTLKLTTGQQFTIGYLDEENPSNKAETRQVVMYANKAEDAVVTLSRQIIEQPPVIKDEKGNVKETPPPVIKWVETKQLVPGSMYQVTMVDPDVTAANMTSWQYYYMTTTLKFAAQKSAATLEIPLYSAPAKPGEGTTFYGSFYVRLGDKNSPVVTFVSEASTRVPFGQLDITSIPVINVQGNDTVVASFMEPMTADGQKNVTRKLTYGVIGNAEIAAQTVQGKDLTGAIKPGMSFVVQVKDPKGDLTTKRDGLTATVTTSVGDSLKVNLTETDFHSGTFTATVGTEYGTAPLKREAPKPAAPATAPAKPAAGKTPAPGGAAPAAAAPAKPAAPADVPVDGIDKVAVTFDGKLTVSYRDPATIEGPAADRSLEIAVRSVGEASGELLTKVYDDPKFEVETLVRLGESFYAVGAAEIAKNPPPAGKPVTNEKLQQARWLFQRVIERFPSSDYVVESLLLSGKILCAEQKYDDGLKMFQRVIDEYPESEFVAQALFQKLQLYTDRKDIDNATETAVQLVSRFPKSTLVADAFLRIAEYYYTKKDYLTAADIYRRTVERFPDNSRVELITYRMATAYYKASLIDDPELQDAADAAREKAIKAYLEFAETYPDHELADDAYYWAATAIWKKKDPGNAMKVLRRMIISTPGDADMRKYGLKLYNDLKQQFPELAASIE